MNHRRTALLVLGAALALDTACGLTYGWAEHIPAWHGLFCALANAVTLGGDVSPVNGGGYVINAVECLTVVPLFAATFSLLTSGLTAVHIRRAKEEIKAHVSEQVNPGNDGLNGTTSTP